MPLCIIYQCLRCIHKYLISKHKFMGNRIFTVGRIFAYCLLQASLEWNKSLYKSILSCVCDFTWNLVRGRKVVGTRLPEGFPVYIVIASFLVLLIRTNHSLYLSEQIALPSYLHYVTSYTRLSCNKKKKIKENYYCQNYKITMLDEMAELNKFALNFFCSFFSFALLLIVFDDVKNMKMLAVLNI